ncbi:SRPBCC family protein [Streptomyces mirabilis]|uniref:SRPBCC family protein n=1 Tax=Streptomyces mirabilis TaxID=68239 RepID=UPI003317DDA3
MVTLKAARVLHVETGRIEEPGLVTVDGDRIAGGGGEGGEGDVLDLGDVTLLPGLMDMEVNLLMGGRGEVPGLSPVQDDPPLRMLRGVANARRTLRSGFTTVLTYHYWPTAVDKHLFEANLYFVPAKTARDRLAQELTAVTFKEYALQDGNTLEATQTMLKGRYVTDFPLNDQEILLRHLHKVVRDYVKEHADAAE